MDTDMHGRRPTVETIYMILLAMKSPTISLNLEKLEALASDCREVARAGCFFMLVYYSIYDSYM